MVSLRESEFAEDLLEIHAKDEALRALGEMVEVDDKLLKNYNISGRTAVREQRNGSWRTRAVDFWNTF